MPTNLIMRMLRLGISPDDLQRPSYVPEPSGGPQASSAVARRRDDRYNDQARLTEAQKEFLTVLARISVRNLIGELQLEIEGEVPWV